MLCLCNRKFDQLSAPIDPHRLGGDRPDGFAMSVLASKTAVLPRQIRYWISVGAVEKPRGRSRAARYTSAHIDQVIAVRDGLVQGDRLQAIAHRRKRQPDAIQGQAVVNLFEDTTVSTPSSSMWHHVKVSETIFIVARVGRSDVERRIVNEMKRVATSMLKETVRPKNGNKLK